VETRFFDAVGGEPFFERLVAAFYGAVEVDEILRPMYPDELADSHRHLTTFLIRHAPFRINMAARDAWLAAMTTAITSVRDELTDEQFAELTAYFDMAAQQMRNV
jgi:hemoglobin